MRESEVSSDEPKSKPPIMSLQLVATQAFVSFVQKLLETTQASQSAMIMLSLLVTSAVYLYYVYVYVYVYYVPGLVLDPGINILIG